MSTSRSALPARVVALVALSSSVFAGCSSPPPPDGSAQSTSSAFSIGPGYLHPFGGNTDQSLCVEADTRNGNYGSGLDLQPCTPHSLQNWQFGNNGQIQLIVNPPASLQGWGNPPYCLNAYDIVNGIVNMQTCNANDILQSWTYYDGRIMPAYYPGFCLDVLGGNQTPGAVWLDITTCNDTASQVFLPEGIPVQLYTNLNVGGGATQERLLDVRGGDSRSTPWGTGLDSDSSNGSPAQFFEFSFGGNDQFLPYAIQITDSVQAQCVTWSVGSSYNGAFLWGCGENNDAYWYYTPQGQFVSRIFNYCLDVNGASATPGTPVDAAPCNGTQAQDWHISVPSLKSPQCKTPSGANTNCHGSWPPPTG